MDIHILGFGRKIAADKGSFVIMSRDGCETRVGSESVDSITLPEGCIISTNAIMLAIEKDIPVILIDNYGRVAGKFFGNRFSSTTKLHKNQAKFADSPVLLEYAKRWTLKKVMNQKAHLEKIGKRKENIGVEEAIELIDSSIRLIKNLKVDNPNYTNKLMGYEGMAGKDYFSVITALIPDRFQFERREYRGAADPYNIILNYSFGMLYSMCDLGLVKAGLDPHIGIIHGDNYNKKSLLYDFIEQFRHLALEFTYTLFSSKLVTNSHFIEREGEKLLSTEGKKLVIEGFNKKLDSKIEYDGKYYKNSEIIKIETRIFASEVMKL